MIILFQHVMNKSIIVFILFSCSIVTSGQDIQLPRPVKTGGMPLMEALSKRQSAREFANKKFDMQTLSDLLWAAYGFNREDKRVVPSSQNKQEIDVFVALAEGLYFYDAAADKLLLRAKGDFRKETGRQDYVSTAPLNLLYVADLNKASNRDAACMDCGFIAQNVYLFCASKGLACVVRGSIDKDALHKILNLTDKQEVLLAQTAGYPK